MVSRCLNLKISNSLYFFTDEYFILSFPFKTFSQEKVENKPR